MNRLRLNSPSALVPPLAGIVFFVMFVMLGFWQLDRAEEKRQVSDTFQAGGDYARLSAGDSYQMYQRITATGRYLEERQFLLENIVQEGRLGYYVITPFEFAAGEPLLLVNRGWLAKGSDASERSAIGIDEAQRGVNGRVGRLPRVAIRPGPPFDGDKEWPMRATWPELGDLAAQLNREVLPFVLLADADPSSALLRRWEPQQIGPMRHLGYAVQWFALALAVAVTALVLIRRTRTAP